MPEPLVPPPSERLAPVPTLTAPQVAEGAGMDLELARRVWRALGMPEAGDDDVQFEDRDVEALRGLKGIMDLGIPLDDLLNVTRLYGRALARIADAETRLFRDHLLEPLAAGGGGDEAMAERARPVVEVLMDISARLLDHVHRRQLSLALDALRATGGAGTTETLAAGFVDLVGFARLSDHLPGDELGALVDAFEHLVVEGCADAEVRLVKVIGDGVMFVSPDPARAVRAAVDIVARVGDHELLPEARGGLDFGEAVTLAGDYFGRPVNVAARITAFARPGTVVVSGELRGAVGEDGLETRRIGSRRLKGVGRVELLKVRSA